MITEQEIEQNREEEEKYQRRIKELCQTSEFRSLLKELYGVRPTEPLIQNYVNWISRNRTAWATIRGSTSEKRLLRFVTQQIRPYEEPEGVYNLQWKRKTPCPNCGVEFNMRHKRDCTFKR